jgi:glyoxylase-like metal-dependent hydrolase (beta-lactamase superfamily II)
VLPGAWRLRLPMRIPGVPHVNAWALKAGDGIVLVDTGVHDKGSMTDLERALFQAGFRIEDVRLIVITHAHFDHCGQAPPIAERAGCEIWMHPAWKLHTGQRLERDVEIARQAGVSEASIRREAARREQGGSGQAGTLRSDRDLVEGVEIETDLGPWAVLETPGHAPSHVCLHQPERRLLISGDHLLGRVSLYFDYGFTPDPVGEFMHSLDIVETLDARLALSGHARPFTDLPGHIRGHRELVQRRLTAVRGELAAGPRTAYDVARGVYGDGYTPERGGWLLTKTLCWLTHLEALGEAAHSGDTPQHWSLD